MNECPSQAGALLLMKCDNVVLSPIANYKFMYFNYTKLIEKTHFNGPPARRLFAHSAVFLQLIPLKPANSPALRLIHIRTESKHLHIPQSVQCAFTVRRTAYACVRRIATVHTNILVNCQS